MKHDWGGGGGENYINIVGISVTEIGDFVLDLEF